MRKLLLVATMLAVTGCAVTGNMEDGYQPGDVTAGMAENRGRYCQPVYVPIRTLGRWLLRLIAYPVPDVCRITEL